MSRVFWPWEVVERDNEIQNPSSPEKIRLAANADHAHAHEFRTAHERLRRSYLRFKRALLGWAIFVGRKA